MESARNLTSPVASALKAVFCFLPEPNIPEEPEFEKIITPYQ